MDDDDGRLGESNVSDVDLLGRVCLLSRVGIIRIRACIIKGEYGRERNIRGWTVSFLLT